MDAIVVADGSQYLLKLGFIGVGKVVDWVGVNGGCEWTPAGNFSHKISVRCINEEFFPSLGQACTIKLLKGRTTLIEHIQLKIIDVIQLGWRSWRADIR